MKNIFTLLAFCLAISPFANAEEVSIESDGSVAEFNYVSVTDPVVHEIDKFDKSKCAAKWREESGVNVSLWSLRGSGSSHFILVNYDNWDMMEKGRAVFTACPAAAMMLNIFKHQLILIGLGIGSLKMHFLEETGSQIQSLEKLTLKLMKVKQVNMLQLGKN